VLEARRLSRIIPARDSILLQSLFRTQSVAVRGQQDLGSEILRTWGSPFLLPPLLRLLRRVPSSSSGRRPGQENRGVEKIGLSRTCRRVDLRLKQRRLLAKLLMIISRR
jgi:hypothetical protein